MQNQDKPTAPAPAPVPPQNGSRLGAMKLPLPLLIGGGVVAFLLLVLIAVNLLISADWVRDRVAARVKEQTGRDLAVNGTTALLFTPSPRVVITDAAFTDPDASAGTADFQVGRLVLDLSFGELFSRQIDADRVVLERPVVTVRLGEKEKPVQRADAAPKAPRAVKAPDDGERPRREMTLRDVRIEDGVVSIIYEEGTEKRIENIDAAFSLPEVTAPLTGSGKFDWKGQTVDFSLDLTSPADLRDRRNARLVLAVETPALAARFDGSIATKPSFTGQGELAAKAHSIPSLLAWMRERPPAATAIGDGELASRVAWKEGEITLSGTRFALRHASGQGQAVVTLKSPRPHVRAALALDHLDLNPFLAKRAADDTAEEGIVKAAAPASAPPGETAVARKPQADGPPAQAPAAPQDWFTKSESGNERVAAAVPQAPGGSSHAPAPAAPAETARVAPAPVPQRAAPPAAFDADVNLNVRKTRVGHLDLGPTSLGLAFRSGVLDATLGGMELYDGNASGTFVYDASKPVPSFTGDFSLEGVQAMPLLSDAAQFDLISGRAKLALQIAGTGDSGEEIKSSLAGQGSVVVSDGAIEGLNITEMISSIGAGNFTDLRQGPGAKTTFKDLGGSFTIDKGVVETNNLNMTSPLLNVAAAGTVDLGRSTLDILAEPTIMEGPEGRGGANDLAGLTVPVRIEGPLADPTIRPELKSMFSDPDKAGQTVNQIGEALQKFKGKPVGEAIGRFLGNIQIGPRGEEEGAGEEAPPRQRSGRAQPPAPEPPAPEPDRPEEEEDEIMDPDLQDILR